MWNISANLRVLKWLAIVLPVLFLLLLDVLRHWAFSEPFHSWAEFTVTYAIVSVVVVIFAYSIFRLIAGLQDKVSEQNRRLTTLNEMASAAAEQLKLEELLGDALDRVMRALNVDAGIVCLVDLKAEEHTAVCVRGFSPEMARKIQRAKLRDDLVAAEVVRTGRPVVFTRVFDDQDVVEEGRRHGIRSGISAPLKSEGEVNGILAVATRGERRFTDVDRDFLNGVGGHLGLAIRNATLFEQSQLQNRELSALVAVGKAVTTSFDLDELLARSLDTIIDVTSSDSAEVWLLEGGDTLAMAAQRGVHPDAFKERTSFGMGEGLPGIVAQTRERIVVHDLPSDPRFVRRKVTQIGVHTFCAIPLLYQSRLVGVLAVAAYSKESMTQEWELRLLDGIGERVATAIENARLHQQVQDVAVLQERERIAREMHDGVGQVLGYINTQTLTVKKLLSDGHYEDARSQLTNMEDMARDLYAEVREGILGLRMGPDKDGGLIPALREYVERYSEMSGIDANIHVSPHTESRRFPPAAEIQLMRIVQEALTNVRKHAEAASVRVDFRAQDGELEVSVEDDGRGFDPARERRPGWPRFGLQTMRERAESIGGTFSIESKPGDGARIVVRIPIGVRQEAPV